MLSIGWLQSVIVCPQICMIRVLCRIEHVIRVDAFDNDVSLPMIYHGKCLLILIIIWLIWSKIKLPISLHSLHTNYIIWSADHHHNCCLRLSVWSESTHLIWYVIGYVICQGKYLFIFNKNLSSDPPIGYVRSWIKNVLVRYNNYNNSIHVYSCLQSLNHIWGHITFRLNFTLKLSFRGYFKPNQNFQQIAAIWMVKSFVKPMCKTVPMGTTMSC